MSSRLCFTCKTTHPPPTGRQCKLANETPLPGESEEDDMDSAEKKVAELKAQIQQEEQLLANTAHILDLEKRLADLKLEQRKLHEERDAVAKSIQIQPSQKSRVKEAHIHKDMNMDHALKSDQFFKQQHGDQSS